MIKVIDIAIAALHRDNFQLKSLVQDLWREKCPLCKYPKPETDDPRILAISAGIMELLAKQWKQVPPKWAATIGAMPEPFYLLKYANKMKNLRFLCETESPEALKKRQLYAPPNFLEFV